MSGTLDAFFRMLAAALNPLLPMVDRGAGGAIALGEELGWILPDPPPAALTDLAGSVGEIVEALADLQDLEHEDASAVEISAAATRLAVAAAAVSSEIAGMPAALAAQLPPAYVAATQIDTQFVDRLYGFLICDAIAQHAPRAHAVMFVAGLIEYSDEPEDEPAFQPEYRRRTLRWDRIGPLLGNPAGQVADLYRWGTETIDAERLFDALRILGVAIITPPTLECPSDALLAVIAPGLDPDSDEVRSSIVFPFFDLADGAITLSLAITPIPPAGGGPQHLAFTVRATGLASFEIPLYPGAVIAMEVATDLSSGFGLVLRPGQSPRAIGSLDTGALFESGRASARFEVTREPLDEEPMELLTIGPALSLTAETMYFGAGVAASGGTVEPFVDGGMEGAKLVIGRGEVDGFVGALLPSSGIAVDFSLAARWSPSGLRLEGSGALETSLPVNVPIGPFRLTSIDIGLTTAAGAVRAEVAVSGGGNLGPLAVSIDRVGIAFDVALTPGNLGPVDIDLAFKPPIGGAIALGAAGISGGGRINFEAAAHRYTGAAHLDAYGVAMNAFTVIETGGALGFSGALVVSATFSPIQIGFGFTLNGVGGMVAIQRRVDVEAIRQAIRGPGMTDLFFPADPLSHMVRLTGELARYFPAAQGRYVLGPAAKIGWGTPTIVEGTVALLLEVPSPVRLALLGNVSTALPTKDNPIIELNVDVVGDVDFARKTLAIDASLHDSQVVGFPITGDMALRMGWGSPPSFALSVGGFHSQFRVPPGFPALRPIKIPIGSGDNPRLDITGFLALTSNTAQVGAQIDLYVAAGPLNIVGNVGFEALLQFLPFAFQVDLWGDVALRRGTSVLASVHLDGTLRGPIPWHIAGEACLSLWFVDLCVGFDATFGQSRDTDLPAREIWPQLKAALEEPRAWSSSLPPGVARAVVTAAAPGDAVNRMDPAAAFAVRQKVVPLNRTIERFAHVPPSDASRFQISGARLGTAVIATPAPIDDWFAPAQFEAFSDAERLSRPGYEMMVAGASLAADNVTTGPELITPVEYETFTFPSPTAAPVPYRPHRDLQIAGTATAANARAPLRPPGRATPRVKLAEETFVIASTEDLTPRLDIISAGARGAAELALRAYLASNPAAAGSLHVVPRFEAVG